MGRGVENGDHPGMRPLGLPTGISDTCAEAFHLLSGTHELQTLNVSSALPRPSFLVMLGASKDKAILLVPFLQWLLALGRSLAGLRPGIWDLPLGTPPYLLHQTHPHGKVLLLTWPFHSCIMPSFHPCELGCGIQLFLHGD